MLEKDYVMRLIREMVRTLVKLLFHMDMEKPAVELPAEREQRERLAELLKLVEDGRINEAENRLSDLTSDGDRQSFALALLFYSYLNEKDDDFLEDHDYSRREIQAGLQAVAADCGLEGVAEMFLEEV